MYVNGFHITLKQPTETVAGAINIYENAIDRPEQIINDLEKVATDLNSNVRWIKAKTNGENMNFKRTNLVLPLSKETLNTSNPLLQKVHNAYHSLLLETSIGYSQQFGIEEEIFFEGYNVLKYSGGQEYQAHYDGGPSTKRYMSPILYLNDDYEGGEIEFVNFGLKIKPKANTLMIFPANYAYTHIAHPVTKGTKYAIVTWIKDRE
jgi:Rps23 Pro-64 3,4-dihydroxylase Tpa1-like proline 4-hydroxylase